MAYHYGVQFDPKFVILLHKTLNCIVPYQLPLAFYKDKNIHEDSLFMILSPPKQPTSSYYCISYLASIYTLGEMKVFTPLHPFESLTWFNDSVISASNKPMSIPPFQKEIGHFFTEENRATSGPCRLIILPHSLHYTKINIFYSWGSKCVPELFVALVAELDSECSHLHVRLKMYIFIHLNIQSFW